jgi:hypothetical protein
MPTAPAYGRSRPGLRHGLTKDSRLVARWNQIAVIPCAATSLKHVFVINRDGTRPRILAELTGSGHFTSIAWHPAP